LQVCAAHRRGWNSSLIKLLTVLFSRLIHRWQESRISALATPTFDVRYSVKAFAHIELFAF
jgi:non-ribosomal peptide synthetase component F